MAEDCTTPSNSSSVFNMLVKFSLLSRRSLLVLGISVLVSRRFSLVSHVNPECSLLVQYHDPPVHTVLYVPCYL